MANLFKVHLEETDVLSESVFNGVDTTNVIATESGITGTVLSNGKIWTATKDCWIMAYGKSYSAVLFVDDVPIGDSNISGSNYNLDNEAANGNSLKAYKVIPVKKGQVFKIQGDARGTHNYKAYAIKR